MIPPHPVSVPRVAIRDLGDRGDKEELRRLFSKFGTLKNVWVADNPPGFAYVFYYNFDDAETAVRHMDGEKVCGTRVRVELTPIDDRRAGRGGGFGGRGRGGGYRSDNRSGPYNRPSYQTREYGRGGRGGQQGFRDSSRSNYGGERSDYQRGRDRVGDRNNYDRPSYGGRGRGRSGGGDKYSPRGHGSSRSGGGGGSYDSGYSEPRYRYNRGRGGGQNYEGSRGNSFRGGGGEFRDREQRSNYDYGNNEFRQSRSSEGYRGNFRGRGEGSMSSQRFGSSQGGYDSRPRRELRRDEIRERDYHAEYGYPAQAEPVASRHGTSRSSDVEYREHRSRPGREDHSRRDDYKRQKVDYRQQRTFSHGHEGMEQRSGFDYRERRSSKGFTKDDFQDQPREWESEVSYRDRSPRVRSPQLSRVQSPHSPRSRSPHSPRVHSPSPPMQSPHSSTGRSPPPRHHRHHYKRERSPLSKHSPDFNDPPSPRSPMSRSPSPKGHYQRDYLQPEHFQESASAGEHYEPVDHYIVDEEYREGARSRNSGVYDDLNYHPPDVHGIEFGHEEHPVADDVIPVYSDDTSKPNEIDRNAREVEYKEMPEEGGRYVKMEEAEDPVRYEKHRVRGRRRYSHEDDSYPTKKGSAVATQRRQRSPLSPPRTRGMSDRSRSPSSHIRSPIRVD